MNVRQSRSVAFRQWAPMLAERMPIAGSAQATARSRFGLRIPLGLAGSSKSPPTIIWAGQAVPAHARAM